MNILPGKRRRLSARASSSTGATAATMSNCLAALRIVLAHHAIFVPLDELQRDCASLSTSSKAATLIRAAGIFGLLGKALRREPKDLRHLPLPIIVFWNGNHIVVVEGFGDDGSALVNDPDPDMVPRVVSTEEFDKSFAGVAVVFQETNSFEGGKQPGLASLILERIPHSSTALCFIVLATVALVVPNLLTPAFSSIFVDDILVNKLSRWTYWLVGIIVTASLLKSGTTYLQQMSLPRFEAKLGLTSSSQFLWHIFRLPKDFFDRHLAG